ncbi:MAG TPA: hypothetical protein VLC98_07555 [Phnomibacter sp.]|nr:hypothetical protein [Phnomibacter sp.]
MQHQPSNRKTYFMACTVALIIAFAVFTPFRSQAQSTKQKANAKPGNATSGKPVTSSQSNATYEEAVVEMQKAMKEVEQSMQAVSKEEAARMKAEMAKAAKELNAQDIRREIELAMKSVDVSAAQLAKELSHDKLMAAEVARAMKEVNLAKMQLQEKDMKELERSLAKAQEELARNAGNIELEMAKAQKDMQAAKVQMELFSKGIAELEKDGLIKKTDPLDIQWENDTLLLNGQKQSKEISDKYRKYFGDGKFHLNGKKKVII